MYFISHLLSAISKSRYLKLFSIPIRVGYLLQKFQAYILIKPFNMYIKTICIHRIVKWIKNNQLDPFWMADNEPVMQICYSVNFAHNFLLILLEDLIFSIFRGPIELALGITLGSLAGAVCWFFPNKSEVKISLWLLSVSYFSYCFGNFLQIPLICRPVQMLIISWMFLGPLETGTSFHCQRIAY